MGTYTVVSNEEYLKSLNITPVHFNFNDQEQLRMHLLSSMICTPKQSNGEGYIDFAIMDENLREISGGCLDLGTIGLAATEGDTVEARKIARNPQRLFHHPMFAGIVKLHRKSGRFRPVLPDVLKPLYSRLLRCGQQAMERERRRHAAIENELSTPENVRRLKVACNFLMELIDRVRHSEKKGYVSWQLVRNRYEKMVSKVDSRDKDLLNKYKCYGLNFAEPFLTRELVKELTGRYTITKALNQPVFRRIQCHVSSGVVMVGFSENAKLYPEEELIEGAEVCQASTSANAVKTTHG